MSVQIIEDKQLVYKQYLHADRHNLSMTLITLNVLP